MALRKLLIANRGEVAVRVARAAADLGIATVAIHSQDDAASLHVQVADEALPLSGRGVPAYLDGAAIVRLARAAGCDAIHPGYGFLAESAAFARACEEGGLRFVGPAVETLELFGDKLRARAAAAAHDVPVLPGTDAPTSAGQAAAFFAGLPAGSAMMIKAVAGGGGRGTRAVWSADQVAAAFERCRSEAQGAFGDGTLYVERMVTRARHVEVQILGDGTEVVQVGERECSAQRRHQKLVEIAPAPGLPAPLRARIIDAAKRVAAAAGYRGLGTFEFLVDADDSGDDSGDAAAFSFVEANPRLQVEHTVTEAVTGLDLVQAQLGIAGGRSLADLGLTQEQIPAARGFAIQARVNLETLSADGRVRPAAGTITAFEPPTGPGVRTDTYGYTGYTTNPAFDSLLAKVVGHSPSPNFVDAVRRTSRALGEFRLAGVATNIPFLRNLIDHPDFRAGRLYTRFVDDHLSDLAAPRTDPRRRPLARAAPAAGARTGGTDPPAVSAHARAAGTAPAGDAQTGGADSPAEFARADAAGAAPAGGANPVSTDPLAVFAHAGAAREGDPDSRADRAGAAMPLTAPAGSVALPAPIQGTVVSVLVAVGDAVHAGQELVVVEAMKMQHFVEVEAAGHVRGIAVRVGDVVAEGHPLVYVEPADLGQRSAAAAPSIDLDHIRPDLQEAIDRHAYTLDENRPEAVAKRQQRGFRMARRNIAQLVDPGSFQEYWPLVVAQQHQRNDDQGLREKTPGDGLVVGTASINGDRFADRHSRAIVVAYDYTVLAGTQGRRNHYKQDRMYELATRYRLPVVVFTEGGGGRPGDDYVGPRVAMDTPTFMQFSQLSGLVPLVGINNGRCFAGNTALLACCDVIIATRNSTIGMGGPAMIEGGGLGVYTPEEVGPMSFQVANGVVDILVEDEASAVDVAKRYLSYFQGALDDWDSHDQRRLRHVVPDNRLRLYDMREVIETIADRGSVLELRERFGVGIITALIRVEGRPMGVLANNPHHLAGAIDSDGADKGARFLQLCDAFDLPVLSLMDCPGIMVGPEHERTALVRHSARMFNTGANLSTPLFGVIVRKAYGLGVQAMCGACSLLGFFTVAWPTAEFSGMNLEGAVKLGYRRELAAIADPEQRRAEFERRVADAYERAKAVNAVAGGGIDDVIDPADTRRWIAASLRRLPPQAPRSGKKRPYVDTW